MMENISNTAICGNMPVKVLNPNTEMPNIKVIKARLIVSTEEDMHIATFFVFVLLRLIPSVKPSSPLVNRKNTPSWILINAISRADAI